MTRKGNTELAAAALVFLLAACANVPDWPTRYGKADPLWSSRYGYSDKAIGGGEFSVVFTASPATTKQRTAQLALLRAAHLTAEQGASHFAIVQQKTVALERYAMVVAPLGGLLVWVPVGETVTREPTAALVIRAFAPGATIPADAIDAAEVIRRLGPELAGK